MTKIAIDGNIGSGKTFYINKLKKDGYTIINCENNTKKSNVSEKYEKNMERYSLALNLEILQNWKKLHYNPNMINIYEQSPYTSINILADLLHEEKIFDTDEYNLYKLYAKDIWIPDIIIYLFCDPDICQERYKLENNLSTDSNQLTKKGFEKIHLKHEIVFDEVNCQIPIYKINSQEDSDLVYLNICDVLKKIEKNMQN